MTVEKVPAGVRALLADDSPLLSPVARADDALYTAKVRAVLDAELVPAITRFAEFLENEYLPRAREKTALNVNPNGAACYPTLVRYFATVQYCLAAGGYRVRG